MTCQIRDNANEHALAQVIDNVECLCSQYATLAAGNVNDVDQVEMATYKVVDQLETSAMNHAKTEVALLTRLQRSLSKLQHHCENVFQSSQFQNRLKLLRAEIEQLITQSAQSSCSGQGPAKLLIGRVSSGDRRVQEEPSTDEVAERTKTPSDEALRPGHDQERSEVVIEVSETALRKFQQQWSPIQNQNGDNASSSADTKATKTKTPSNSNPDQDERSQRIWLDEDAPWSTPPIKQRFQIASPRSTVGLQRGTIKSTERNARSSIDTKAIKSKAPSNSSNKEDRSLRIWLEEDTPSPSIATKQRIRTGSPKMEMQRETKSTEPIAAPSLYTSLSSRDEQRAEKEKEKEPTIGQILQLPESAPFTMQVRPLVKECEAEVVWAQATRTIVTVVSVATLPLLLVWLLLWIHEWNRSCLASAAPWWAIGWRIWCGVANAFCETYGTLCSSYCSSGVQRDQWQSCR